MSVQALKVVDLEYQDLVDGKDLTDAIYDAYGPDGYGILLVSNVPDVLKYRNTVLPLSYKFANLPEEIKNKYVDVESNYSFGWSHGKESFNGKLDFAKGSYYANPTIDSPTDDQELKVKAPFFCRDNIWPTEDLPEFEKAFKNMSQLLVKVGTMVARQCDALAHKINPSYKKGQLYDTIVESKCHKARLLYYFPMPKKSEEKKDSPITAEEADSWCGWHTDTDTLTGLLKAMYFDENGKCLDGIFSDPEAGLYIKDRKGEMKKAAWKPDQIAFQIGECSQLVTGGHVRATPHCVRGSEKAQVGRSQMACFMQPTWDVLLSPPEGVNIKDCEIPNITEPCAFMDYSAIRFKEYYQDNPKGM